MNLNDLNNRWFEKMEKMESNTHTDYLRTIQKHMNPTKKYTHRRFDRHEIFSKDDKNHKNVTFNKYQNKINNVKNEKIKKSLIELTKVFKEK